MEFVHSCRPFNLRANLSFGCQPIKLVELAPNDVLLWIRYKLKWTWLMPLSFQDVSDKAFHWYRQVVLRKAKPFLCEIESSWSQRWTLRFFSENESELIKKMSSNLEWPWSLWEMVTFAHFGSFELKPFIPVQTQTSGPSLSIETSVDCHCHICRSVWNLCEWESSGFDSLRTHRFYYRAVTLS